MLSIFNVIVWLIDRVINYGNESVTLSPCEKNIVVLPTLYIIYTLRTEWIDVSIGNLIEIIPFENNLPRYLNKTNFQFSFSNISKKFIFF